MKFLSLLPCSFLFVLLLILLSGPAAAGAPRLVRVGAFSLYPAIFQDTDGKIKGFYVDMLAEISAKENLRIEYVYGSWKEGLERIKSREVDLLTSVAYSEECARDMDYGKIPLLTVWAELYVKKDSDLNSLMAVEGKKIAVMKGDHNARYFMKLVEKFGFHCEYLEEADFDAVFQSVRQGRADAGVANVIFGSAKRQEYDLTSSEVMFNPFDIYFAVGKGQNAELLATLDHYLGLWRGDENSIYHQARHKWGGGQGLPIEVIPIWVYQVAGGVVLLIVAGGIFILLLRRQVRIKTAEIEAREAVLRENHLAYLSLLATTHDGFWLTDTQGRLLEVNDAYVTRSGYSREELLAMQICDLEALMNREEVAARIQNVMTIGSKVFESGHQRKDGSAWPVEISCSYSASQGGRLYIFIRDITDRNKAKEALQQKNAEMERFVYTVSHDLRSPLVTVKSFLGLLQQDIAAEDQPQIEKDLGYIKAATNKMETMLNELLQLSRAGRVPSHPVEINLRSLVDEALATVAGRLVGKGIQVNVSTPQFILYGEEARLMQIWQNLIENSIKYMGEQPEAKIEIGMEKKKGAPVFFVCDNGIGIDPGDTEKIFDLFTQINGQSEGSGLGLALVKRIVELYSGRIWVESAGIGKGSCFKFTLPEATDNPGKRKNDNEG